MSDEERYIADNNSNQLNIEPKKKVKTEPWCRSLFSKIYNFFNPGNEEDDASPFD